MRVDGIDVKTIPNFLSYSISKDGQVWSKRQSKWLKPTFDSHRYYYVCLCVNRQYYKRSIHCLVLETYISPRPSGMVCRHLNGCVKDNRVGNLKWGTQRENVADAVKFGTHRSVNQSGEENINHKLTEQQVRQIIYIYRTGLFPQKEIAEQYGITQSVVSKIIRGKAWKHIWTDK